MQLQRSDERMLQIEEITFLDFERGPDQLIGAGFFYFLLYNFYFDISASVLIRKIY